MSPPEISNYYSANFFAFIVMFPVLAPDFDPVFFLEAFKYRFKNPSNKEKSTLFLPTPFSGNAFGMPGV
jgi:hypothetical protein